MKGEKPRTIRSPQAVMLELQRHPRDLRGGGLLFCTPRTGLAFHRHEFYARGWYPALASAGLAVDRYKFHALPHFCASSMLAAGVNPVAVSGHLGDTLETLYRVYAHWLRDDRDVSADALDRLLFVHGMCTGRGESDT